MKTKVLVALALLVISLGSFVTYAVSLEFVILDAVEMGDIEITEIDGEINSVTVDFSGPELKTLMMLLPEVRDGEEEGSPVVEYMRWIDIRGDETNGKVSRIGISCESKEYNEEQALVDVKNEVKCTVSISKGSIAG